jgi:dolichol-phosphate mannosyltransferase
MTVFIILPIYNEKQNIEDLIKTIHKTCQGSNIDYHIVAVDDGSIDGTAAVLSLMRNEFPITKILHKRNRGLGETIRDGFEHATEQAKLDDIILRMDADSTHEPKYIPHLVSAIENGCDVAIASRFSKGGGEVGLSSDRKWISKIANLAFRICFPIGGIKEYTCGYRAYRASILQRALDHYGNNFIQLRGLGFCCTVEKLLKLKLMGAKLEEVPFVLKYDLKMGPSKMPFNVTTFGYMIMVILYHWPISGWKASIKRTQ